MARIVFPDNFVALTGGEREFNIDVGDYRALVMELKKRWPQLAGLLEKTAVAIDGQIYQDAFLETINTDSEVFFMARIEGG